MEEFGIYLADFEKCNKVINDFCRIFDISQEEYDDIIDSIKAHIVYRLREMSYCNLDDLTDIINRCRVESFVVYAITKKEIPDKDLKFGVNGSDIYIAYKGQTIC